MKNRSKKDLITEIEQLRKQIQETSLTDNQETKFQEVFEKSADALLIIKNNIFTDCNIATCKMLGYGSKNKFLNVHPSKLSPKLQPDGKDSFIKAEEMMSLAFKNGSHRFKWMHTKNNGKDFPVEVLLTEITNQPNIKTIYCVWRDITKREKDEKELLENKEKFSNLYNNSPDMYVSVSAEDATILRCNDTLLKNTNYARKEIIGSPIFKMYHDDCMNDVKKAFNQFATEGSVKNKKLILKKKNGDKIFVSLNVSSVRDNAGKILHSISSWRDITEQKEIETKILESEEQNRLIVENAPYCIHQIDLKNKFISINKAGVKMMQASGSIDIIGTDFLDAVADCDKDKIRKLFKKAISGKKVFTEFNTNNNQIFSTSFIPLFNKEKVVVRIMGITQNITQRISIKKQLIESEMHFRTIYENSPVLIDAFDKDGKCILWNKECEQTFGWTKDELNTHDNSLKLFYPNPKIQQEVLQSITTNPDGNFKERNPLTKEGKKITVMWASFSLPDGLTYNIGYDITERVIAEKELSKYRNQLEIIVKTRTKELEDRNKELDKAVKVFVGRELKIRALEKSIKTLKKK